MKKIYESDTWACDYYSEDFMGMKLITAADHGANINDEEEEIFSIPEEDILALAKIIKITQQKRDYEQNRAKTKEERLGYVGRIVGSIRIDC